MVIFFIFKYKTQEISKEDNTIYGVSAIFVSGYGLGMTNLFFFACSGTMLNGSRVLPIVGQLKAGGVTQHVRMDRDGNSCPLSGPGYNLAES